MEECPDVGGDTAWVSGYGLYDELSPHMKTLLEGLHAVHTSRLQYETTIVSIGFPLSLCFLAQTTVGRVIHEKPFGTSFTSIEFRLLEADVTDFLSSGLLRR